MGEPISLGGKSGVTAWLDGKKTYIGVIAGVVYSVLVYFNAVPNNQMVWTIIAGWTGVSARAAISKV